MIAHVIGSTGLTGSALLDLLLTEPRIEKVHSYSRSKTNKLSSKLEEHLGDLTDADYWDRDLAGDLLFICIGTTQAKTPDRQLYYAIDYGIPVAAARAAKKGGLSKVLVISSLGADARSKSFYLRTKGEMEKSLMDLYPAGLSIFQPSLIMGDRQESRFLEGISQKIFKLLKPVIPKKYQGVDHRDIVKAMLKLGLAPEIKAARVIPSDEIPSLAERY